MANHKSAKKRAKQTIKRTEANRSRKTQVRTVVKKLRGAIEQSDKQTAQTLVVKAQSLIDKLAKSGILKANTAARKVSRLAAQVAKISQ